MRYMVLTSVIYETKVLTILGGIIGLKHLVLNQMWCLCDFINVQLLLWICHGWFSAHGSSVVAFEFVRFTVLARSWWLNILLYDTTTSDHSYRHSLQIRTRLSRNRVSKNLLLRSVSSNLALLRTEVRFFNFVSDTKKRVLALSYSVDLLSIQFLLVSQSDFLLTLALGGGRLLELYLFIKHPWLGDDRIYVDLHLGSVFLRRNAVKRLGDDHLGWSHLSWFKRCTSVCGDAFP